MQGISRGAYLLACVAWFASLGLPAISTGQQVHEGWTLLITGFATLIVPQVIFGYASVASWCANLLLGPSVWLGISHRPLFALALSTPALGVALLACIGRKVPLGEEFAEVPYALEVGAYVWLSAMGLSLLGSIAAVVAGPIARRPMR